MVRMVFISEWVVSDGKESSMSSMSSGMLKTSVAAFIVKECLQSSRISSTVLFGVCI